MSNAPRDATWNSRSRSCDGQDRWLGQRMSTSPSLAGASGVPHDGHCVGMTNARSVPSRRSTTGPTISGITSPALRSTTVSPMSTPLRATSLALCSVAISTVDPDTNTGSITAERRHAPGAPDVHADVEELGVHLLGRVLVRDRPPRRPAGRRRAGAAARSRRPSRRCRRSRARRRAGARRSSAIISRTPSSPSTIARVPGDRDAPRREQVVHLRLPLDPGAAARAPDAARRCRARTSAGRATP